jgi:hypothetical protein
VEDSKRKYLGLIGADSTETRLPSARCLLAVCYEQYAAHDTCYVQYVEHDTCYVQYAEHDTCYVQYAEHDEYVGLARTTYACCT